MISRNELKYLKSLHLKKFRDEERKFIAEGKNSVEEGLKSRYGCSLLLFTENFISEAKYMQKLAGEKNIRFEVIGENDFNRIADSVNPQGVLAVFDIPEAKRPDFTKMNHPVIFLDEISDPGNAGTIIRTCDWFGFRNVILSKNSADIYNSKTVRSSAGSLFHINLFAAYNIEEISAEAKKEKFRILSADIAGENINSYKWINKIVIVFSNEAGGVSPYVRSVSDDRISVPGFGKAESLNVAAAAAVILYQVRITLK
ncbi:MAG: RNA methyltransferase [Ignavibacteriales bacterium]|nr:MAG: RNA methyltransferase [Ignavibacteriales bacterium]